MTAGSAVLELVLPAHADPPVGRCSLRFSAPTSCEAPETVAIRRMASITRSRQDRVPRTWGPYPVGALTPGGYLERVIVWLAVGPVAGHRRLVARADARGGHARRPPADSAPAEPARTAGPPGLARARRRRALVDRAERCCWPVVVVVAVLHLRRRAVAADRRSSACSPCSCSAATSSMLEAKRFRIARLVPRAGARDGAARARARRRHGHGAARSSTRCAAARAGS